MNVPEPGFRRVLPGQADAWRRFDDLPIEQAAERVAGVVKSTPLVPLDLTSGLESPEEREDLQRRLEGLDLRFKLENRQETGAFKARGAWNQIAQLTEEERQRGVVCASSGNHGGALAWAAQRAGVRAVIVMPENAYPNKIAACADRGAEVVLMPDRGAADRECQRLAAEGMTLVHPYDARKTLQGAGTVTREILAEWPEVDVVVVPVGGGGLISGSALAVRQSPPAGRDPEEIVLVGAEPQGAPALTRALLSGENRPLEQVTSTVQGLTPPRTGDINMEICSAALDATCLLDDETILAVQRVLLRAGEHVEPAGAAATALVLSGGLDVIPKERLAHRSAQDPLRVAVVVSGGNPDPAQVEAMLASPARDVVASEGRGESREAHA